MKTKKTKNQVRARNLMISLSVNSSSSSKCARHQPTSRGSGGTCPRLVLSGCLKALETRLGAVVIGGLHHNLSATFYIHTCISISLRCQVKNIDTEALKHNIIRRKRASYPQQFVSHHKYCFKITKTKRLPAIIPTPRL